jgi:DNA-binding MarR family transcriptional regulator
MADHNALVQIVQEWAQYALLTQHPTPEGFAHFLLGQAGTHAGTQADAKAGTEAGTQLRQSEPVSQTPEHSPTDPLRQNPPIMPTEVQTVIMHYKSHAITDRISILVGLLSRLSKWYGKKAFAEKDINLDEFTMLLSIAEMREPRHKDIFLMQIIETTTGTQAIRRMIAKGWISEESHKTDKRAKTLSLTLEGMMVIRNNIGKLQELSWMITSPLTEPEKLQLAELLGKIFEPHIELYICEHHSGFDDLHSVLTEKYSAT